MLQMAICDDMPVQLKQINAAVTQYLETEKEEQIQITCFENSLELLDCMDKKGGYDIVFLDICMPGLNGMDIAREIRNRKDKTEIIFITNSDEFAVDAFSLKAAHYLLKPFTQNKLNEAIDRALAAFETRNSLKLYLKLSGGGVCMVDLNEIVCIENFNHEQQVYLKDGEMLKTRASLTMLLSQAETLSPGQFLSPYKGYLVNIKAVRSVEPDRMKLHGGRSVPIVRRNYRILSEQCFAYGFRRDKERRLLL